MYDEVKQIDLRRAAEARRPHRRLLGFGREDEGHCPEGPQGAAGRRRLIYRRSTPENSRARHPFSMTDAGPFFVVRQKFLLMCTVIDVIV